MERLKFRKIDASLSHLENCSSRQINVTLRHGRAWQFFYARIGLRM
jgi:hypothetical protein